MEAGSGSGLVIREWGAHALVTLIEPFEFELLSVPELPEKVQALGVSWIHLPIIDVWIPDARFEEAWETVGAELRHILRGGGRIVLHCRGGLGRTGTIAARLLVEFGMLLREAIRRVRAARPGAIQTREQEEYVLRCKPGLVGMLSRCLHRLTETDPSRLN